MTSFLYNKLKGCKFLVSCKWVG